MFMPRAGLQRLLDALSGLGFHCVGPKAKNGAIQFGTLQAAEDLPIGMQDEQLPGTYRLHKTSTSRMFAWANGPQALKPFLFAPKESLWQARQRPDGKLEFHADLHPERPLAVFGVRACDLAALRMQNQHFMGQAHGAFPDPYYASRCEGLFLIAVNCSHPASTCFCASTGDGPCAEAGFDIVLDERDDGFVAAFGSERGEAILASMALASASELHRKEARRQTQHASAQMKRRLPSRNLRDALFSNLNHSRWDDVSERCLSCGNCTSVCPTCFCHSERESQEVDGMTSEHFREWDSCFTRGHSYIHGLTVRPDTRTRYRQWLTHKLGSWHDQFGRSGCVGCGRCITWCPVGIDITEEATVICGDGR